MRRLAAAVLMLTWAAAGLAQVPPSSAEIAAYTGLHAAAHRGDLPTLVRLAAQRDALRQLDDHGRAPLHVARSRASARP